VHVNKPRNKNFPVVVGLRTPRRESRGFPTPKREADGHRGGS